MRFPAFKSVKEIKKHLTAIGYKISHKDLLTDGCSMAPDFDFIVCCKMHDFWYETGLITRLEADVLLKKCIRTSSWFWPNIYYIGVRLGGRKRWNFYRKFELERDYEWSQAAVEMQIFGKINNIDLAYEYIDKLRLRYREEEIERDRINSPRNPTLNS